MTVDCDFAIVLTPDPRQSATSASNSHVKPTNEFTLQDWTAASLLNCLLPTAYRPLFSGKWATTSAKVRRVAPRARKGL